MKEFDLIEQFFNSSAYHRQDVVLGIGDDAALLQVPQGKWLVSCTDSFVADTHFFADAPAEAVGYKALAVNLSDFAAMGATPYWVSLALTLPSSDEAWLKKFAAGFFRLIDQYQLQIIGGDTTKGPLSITPQILGFVEPHQVLRRDTAKPGDIIYVTGSLGDAAFAVGQLQQKKTPPVACLHKLYYPIARVIEGKALIGHANAAIDISDGLLADLNHLLSRSQVGAIIDAEKLPLSDQLLKSVSLESAMAYALYGGDDYELCVTVAKEKEKAFQKVLNDLQCPHHAIGIITAEKNLYLKTSKSCEQIFNTRGYDHFLTPHV
jgi:thiamine-monophosphate kinase